MRYDASLSGEAAALFRKFKINADVLDGQAVIWVGTSTPNGSIKKATTTGAASAFGCTMEAGTYSTSQATTDAEVNVVYNPLAVFEAVASGGATESTALNSTAPANILTNTSASSGGTVITAAEVGTVSMVGGMVFAINGANKGQARILQAHSNSTSTTVTVPFSAAIAVNDKFVRLPWAPGIKTVQFTTNIYQADATIVVGTGAEAVVTHVIVDDFDPSSPKAKVFFMFRDHVFNPLA